MDATLSVSPDGLLTFVVTGMPSESDGPPGLPRVLDRNSSLSESDDEPDASTLNFRGAFIQMCVENEELRGHILELQEQLRKLMKAQVQDETHPVRNQSVAFEALRQENAPLQRQLTAFRVGEKPIDCLQTRGKVLMSILDGIDHSSTPFDDRDSEVAGELSQRLLETDRKCAQCRDLLSAAQTENAALHRELAAARDGHCYDTEIALLTAERNELQADVVRIEAMKDCIADSLDEQVDYLQSTIESVSSERDELQVRVNEQEKLMQAFDRLAVAGGLGGSITSVVRDCLAVVKESQLENARAHEELRMLHHQLHELEAENFKLKGIVGARAAQFESDDE
jgi:predicted RNase H-like nuclease (RuvC/YqgF family)